MTQILLVVFATVLYAGYNLLIKVSGDHVPASASTTILATLILQFSALCTSLLAASFLTMKGTSIFGLTPKAYMWAVLAGICIGAAEIIYLYVFSGLGIDGEKLPANAVIPFVVGGTVVITMIVSAVIFKEAFGWSQMVGSCFIVLGIAFLFTNTQLG